MREIANKDLGDAAKKSFKKTKTIYTFENSFIELINSINDQERYQKLSTDLIKEFLKMMMILIMKSMMSPNRIKISKKHKKMQSKMKLVKILRLRQTLMEKCQKNF